MNESEQNKPDDFWKKSFDEASEMPPPRVWDAIERQLDKSEEGILTGPKIVPLWDSGGIVWNRFAWSAGIAAALALLLTGWWSLSTTGPSQQPVAQHRSPRHPQYQSTPASSAQTPDLAINQPGSHSTNTTLGTAVESSAGTRAGLDHRAKQMITPAPELADRIATQTTLRPATKQPAPDSPLPVMATSATNRLMYGAQPVLDEARPVRSRAASVAFTSVATATTSESQADPLTVIKAEQLAGRPLQRRDLEPIQRIVWISPLAGVSEEKVMQSTQKSREVWASVSVMPGAFDPSVSIRSAQAVTGQSLSSAFALNSSAGNSQRSVNSRAGLSVTYQTMAGVQVTPRWSIEGGVGYLAGHAFIESPAQVTTYANTVGAVNRLSTSGNPYVNALRNSLPTTYKSPVADIVAYPSQVSYDAQSQQSLTNNYRFVQVPVQVGYQLRPRKRFGLAVLGGLLTNIFVRNTVGDNVVINSQDGVYRPLSWSATLGARFRYRPSRRWSASLAGLYQTALGSGTESTSLVQNRLSATGMSVGVDYHF